MHERTALWKKRDMGRQDGTEAAELRRLSVAFLFSRGREVQKISANFLYQMNARMEFLRTTGRCRRRFLARRKYNRLIEVTFQQQTSKQLPPLFVQDIGTGQSPQNLASLPGREQSEKQR